MQGTTNLVDKKLDGLSGVVIKSYPFENMKAPANGLCDVDVSSVLDGYNLVGIVGWQVNGSSASTVYAGEIGNGIFRLRLRNQTSSEVTLNGVFSLLFSKNQIPRI